MCTTKVKEYCIALNLENWTWISYDLARGLHHKCRLVWGNKCWDISTCGLKNRMRVSKQYGKVSFNYGRCLWL